MGRSRNGSGLSSKVRTRKYSFTQRHKFVRHGSDADGDRWRKQAGQKADSEAPQNSVGIRPRPRTLVCVFALKCTKVAGMVEAEDERGICCGRG